MYVLADDTIAALGNPKRGVHAVSTNSVARNAMRSQQTKIRTARKFVLDDDLVRYAAKLACRMSPTQMLALVEQYSRAPYSKVWIEWNEHVRVHAIQQYVVDSYENKEPFFRAKDKESKDILEKSVQLAKDALDKGEAYLQKNIAERCGYLIEERINPAIRKEESIFTCHFFVSPNNDIGLGNKAEAQLISSAMGFSIRFEEPYSKEDHISLLKNFDKNIDTSEEALQENMLSEIKLLFLLNSQWWSHLHQKDDNLSRYFMRMRPVQCEPVYWWCRTEKGFSVRIMEELSKHFVTVLEGDPRFIITVLALLNYDWVLKDNKARSTTPRRRFGKQVTGNSYSIVSIDLPKRRGVEVFMRDLDKDAESTMRLHEVRGHWCVSKTTGKRWWRKSHKRGDASLGVINHDYELNHGGDEWKSSKNAASAAA
jgi:hypothetical protein